MYKRRRCDGENLSVALLVSRGGGGRGAEKRVAPAPSLPLPPRVKKKAGAKFRSAVFDLARNLCATRNRDRRNSFGGGEGGERGAGACRATIFENNAKYNE